MWPRPIRPGLRIYETKANHFEERRPCLPPRHCSVLLLLRVGRRGGVGMARGPAGALGMDEGEEKNLRNQGQKSFCEQERKLSRLPSCAQVRSHNGEQGPPKGAGGLGASRPLPTHPRRLWPQAPSSPLQAEPERVRPETFLEATMADRTLGATTSPLRRRGAASNLCLPISEPQLPRL